MTRKVTSLPLGQLSGGYAAASAGAFYSNTVATLGAVGEGAINESSSVVAPSCNYSFPPNGNGQNAAGDNGSSRTEEVT